MIAAAARSRRRSIGWLAPVLGLTLGVLTFGIPTMASAGGVPTCFGRTATIVGHAGPERIEGTPGNDVIVGLGSRDIISGGEGNDFICGNNGSDVIDGGPGDDSLSGGYGRDFITGVDGDDLILGGQGADTLNFGDEENGDDQVFGGRGDDDLHAGVGIDRLFGNRGDDFLAEGEVDAPLVDLFSGGTGADTCFAGVEDELRGCETTS
jgi:Ca2+-binding RTX toxin-like protein